MTFSGDLIKHQDMRDQCFVTDLGKAKARQTEPPSCQSSPAASTENLMTEASDGRLELGMFLKAHFLRSVCQGKAASSPLHWTVVFLGEA